MPLSSEECGGGGGGRLGSPEWLPGPRTCPRPLKPLRSCGALSLGCLIPFLTWGAGTLSLVPGAAGRLELPGPRPAHPPCRSPPFVGVWRFH